MFAALDPRVYIAAALLVLVTSAGSYFYGRHDGSAVERAAWQKEKLTLVSDSQKLIATAIADNEKTLSTQRALAQRTSDEYQSKIVAIDDKYRAARVTGGLRIPVTTCRSADAIKAVATGAGRLDESTAKGLVSGEATERIPSLTEDRLYELAKDADALAEQLTALQSWVRNSGLF